MFDANGITIVINALYVCTVGLHSGGMRRKFVLELVSTMHITITSVN